MKKQIINKWKLTCSIFNSKNSGKCFTRNEIKMLFEKYNIKYDFSSCMTYVNTLLRAGYLSNQEPGIYRKLKKIPDISERSLRKLIKKRKENQ